MYGNKLVLLSQVLWTLAIIMGRVFKSFQ